jgi:Coatomer epsilon subunit
VEAVALIVQIHLEQNRTDLAIKEVAAARRWAQDSLLVNLAESWVGLRVVCSQSYRNARTDNARAERNISKPSTSLKSLHKLLQPLQSRV